MSLYGCLLASLCPLPPHFEALDVPFLDVSVFSVSICWKTLFEALIVD